jgi:RNA polymerase sigma-70 factor (ECF subfamily)
LKKLQLNKKDLEYLFKEYYSSLYYYVLSYTNDIDVSQDIVSDIFEQLWTERDQLDISYSIKPFLYRMAKNKSINYLRHQEVKQKYVDFSMKNQHAFEDNHDEHESLVQRIIKEIENLPPKSKAVFKLCFLENKKYQEVGDELNISINTVKTHIKKALKFMREKFDPETLILFLIINGK